MIKLTVFSGILGNLSTTFDFFSICVVALLGIRSGFMCRITRLRAGGGESFLSSTGYLVSGAALYSGVDSTSERTWMGFAATVKAKTAIMAA